MFHFQILALLLLVAAAVSLTPPYYDLNNAEQLYAEFIKKYNRHFESIEEFTKRFEAFKENLKKLNEWNDYFKYEDGGFFINRFSDEYEHKSCYRPSLRPHITQQVKKEFIDNAPDSIDYRKQNLVSPVRDQGEHCGDCYIFGAIENIEGVYAKQTGNLLSLSEQQALDCVGTCDGGDPLQVMNDMASQGCMTEEDYPPYVHTKQTCRTDKSKVKVKVTGGTVLSTPDVDSLKGALAQNGAPLAITMYASPQMIGHQGPNILTPTDCAGHKSGNHAVLLVGYDKDPTSGKSYWIIKNSWGTDHGDQGYFYLDFQSTADCKIGAESTATASVE